MKKKKNKRKIRIRKNKAYFTVCTNVECKLRKAGCKGFEGCPGYKGK